MCMRSKPDLAAAGRAVSKAAACLAELRLLPGGRAPGIEFKSRMDAAPATMREMRLGSLSLASNLFLSPLAGYTTLPFRLTIRELGGLGLATTDLVNARSLLERRTRALKMIESTPLDRPLAVQLFGAVPEEMRDAAVYLESIGIDSVDINMGCPVRKVVRIGGGSAMMTELAKTAHLVRMMVKAVKVPVTAKMRLGWDEEN